MSLITPDFGLFFWMLLAFGVVFFLLRKFAWGPIMQGLQSRESSISEALSKAEQAHGEVLRMQEQSKVLEAEGRAARVKMISEAERLREQMMREAREQAQAEAERYREESRQAMEQERVEARRRCVKRWGGCRLRWRSASCGSGCSKRIRSRRT